MPIRWGFAILTRDFGRQKCSRRRAFTSRPVRSAANPLRLHRRRRSNEHAIVTAGGGRAHHEWGGGDMGVSEDFLPTLRHGSHCRVLADDRTEPSCHHWDLPPRHPWRAREEDAKAAGHGKVGSSAILSWSGNTQHTLAAPVGICAGVGISH